MAAAATAVHAAAAVVRAGSSVWVAVMAARQGAEAPPAMGLVACLVAILVEASTAAQAVAMRAASLVDAMVVVVWAVVQAVAVLMEVARAAVEATSGVAATAAGGAAPHHSCTIRQGSACRKTHRAAWCGCRPRTAS